MVLIVSSGHRVDDIDIIISEEEKLSNQDRDFHAEEKNRILQIGIVEEANEVNGRNVIDNKISGNENEPIRFEQN